MSTAARRRLVSDYKNLKNVGKLYKLSKISPN